MMCNQTAECRTSCGRVSTAARQRLRPRRLLPPAALRYDLVLATWTFAAVVHGVSLAAYR